MAIDPPVTRETVNAREPETCRTQVESHQRTKEVYRRCTKEMRDQASHSLSTALAATMTDQMHSDGNREEVREHKEKEGKKKSLPEQPNSASDRPCLPDCLVRTWRLGHRPRTLVEKIQQLVCYFFKQLGARHARTHTHKSYSGRARSIGLPRPRRIYTGARARSWLKLAG